MAVTLRLCHYRSASQENGMKQFIEGLGGRIISTTTGEVVVTVEVDRLTTHDATRITAAVLTALEAEFAPTKAETAPTA